MPEFGIVRTVVTHRGFLFLTPDYGGKDVFCHFSEVEKAGLNKPEVGDRLSYEIKSTDRGPQAINLKPL
jgi:cold shock protein